MGKPGREPKGEGKNMIQGILDVSKISNAHEEEEEKEVPPKGPKVMSEGTTGHRNGRKGRGDVWPWTGLQTSTPGGWTPKPGKALVFSSMKWT